MAAPAVPPQLDGGAAQDGTGGAAGGADGALAGAASARNAAILKKVTKVLSSSSRARSESEDVTLALRALSAFYVPAGAAVLDAPDRADEGGAALLLDDALDPRGSGAPGLLPGDGVSYAPGAGPPPALAAPWNTLQARRGLRSELERRVVRTAEALVESFGPVAEDLEAVERVVDELATDCQRIAGRLQAARQTTSHLVERTAELHTSRDQVRARLRLVEQFLARFQLTPDEVEALETGPISGPFFAALERISVIRGDCRELLRSYHQRVGLDIVDALGRRVERGYSRLYVWAQQQAKEAGGHHQHNHHQPQSGDGGVPSAEFARALAVLQGRPAYFQHCLQEAQQARRVVLIRRFMVALTRGGPGGLPRPIELSAHDPVRYVGDMLAWVHQAVASEREYFDAALDQVPADRGRDELGRQLLGQVVAGLAKPISVRVQQALQSPSGAVAAPTALGVASVLQFYSGTIGQQSSSPPAPAASVAAAAEPSISQSAVSGSDGGAGAVAQQQQQQSLPEVLLSLRREADSAVLESLNQVGRRLVEAPLPQMPDLAPSRPVVEALAQLDRLMVVYSRSLSGQNDVEFAPILSAAIEPVLSATDASAAQLDAVDSCILRANTVGAIYDTVRKFPFTQSRQETLSLATEKLTNEIVGMQADAVMRKGGLWDVMDALVRYRGGAREEGSGPMSHAPGLDETRVTEAAQAFYKTVFGLGAFAIAQCDRILSPETRATVRRGVARAVSEQYRKLHAAVHAPESRYARPSEALPHSPDAIDTLLEVPRDR